MPEQDGTSMDISDVVKNLPVINEAASDMLDIFGPEFTNTPGGHIETDIAAAASLAGLMILRSRVPDMSAMPPGSAILFPMDEELDLIHNFMTGVCVSLDLEPSCGWDTEIPDENKPLFSIPDLTQKTEKDFLSLCREKNLPEEFFPFVAILGSLKIVSAGRQMGLLDQDMGKSLAAYYVYAGARTVPYPES